VSNESLQVRRQGNEVNGSHNESEGVIPVPDWSSLHWETRGKREGGSES